MSTPRSLAVLLASLLAACGSAEPAEPPPYAPRPVIELARWQVLCSDTPIGVVRHLEIRDPTGPLAYYRIEDLDGRWLGHATDAFRFSRRVPFQEQEQDLGVWSLPRGTAELLDAKGSVELKPVALDADAKKR
jgi:hypothetical protein